MCFDENTAALAEALDRGDIGSAKSALDNMARDGERPTAEMIAKGRAAALRPRGDLRQFRLALAS